MRDIINRETRVEFDKETWEEIKPEFSEWIQKRGTGYRDLTVYYWDGVAMTQTDAHTLWKEATALISNEPLRQSLLSEADNYRQAGVNLPLPDELVERMWAFNDKRDAAEQKAAARFTSKFFIAFNNADDAMLFKLTWGGEA